MAYPNQLPDFATDGSADVVEIPTSKKEAGFRDREKLPNGWVNWIFNLLGLWIRALYETAAIEFESVPAALVVAQDWQTVRVVDKTASGEPGDQHADSPSSVNLGVSAQVAGASFDGRYLYVIEGLVVKRWDLLDGTYTGTSYAPGWASGSITYTGTNGAYLVIAGQDTSADKGKATLIDLSDGSTVATVEISSTAATVAVRRVRVGHTHAWVARTANATDTHDTTRILLSDGSATNLALLDYGTTDSPAGFDIDDDHVYVGDGANRDVFIYNADGTTELASGAASTAAYNVKDLRVVRGKIFVIFESSVGAAPLVLAKFDNLGNLLEEVEVSATKKDFMLTVDDEFVYVIVGDASGAAATIETRAYRVEDLSMAWRRLLTWPATLTGFDGLWADGIHLWADTTSAGNPQVRRLHTSHRSQLLTKIPPGERGQRLGLLLTRDR